MVHQKTDGVAAAATTKTFIDLLGRGNGKRGRFFVVKRAETEVIGTSFFEFDEAADDIDDIDPALYLLYGLLADQEPVNVRRECRIQNTEFRRTCRVVWSMIGGENNTWKVVYDEEFKNVRIKECENLCTRGMYPHKTPIFP
jgi:hypothetical protein